MVVTISTRRWLPRRRRRRRLKENRQAAPTVQCQRPEGATVLHVRPNRMQSVSSRAHVQHGALVYEVDKCVVLHVWTL